MLERHFPLRRPKCPLVGRLLVNLSFAAVAFVTVALTVRPAPPPQLSARRHTVALAFVCAARHPTSAGLFADGSDFYWWHRANHRIELLWRFHNVYHLAPDLDVSTAFRFHFGELAFSSAFRVFQIALIGPSLWVYLVYEIVFQVGTPFHHSNLRRPLRVERLLVCGIVTPLKHGIYHSQVPQETHSNYATVFPFWDRLHGTLDLNVSQNSLNIGAAGYAQKKDNQLSAALLLPFRRQRDYWRRTDGTVQRRGGARAQQTRLAS